MNSKNILNQITLDVVNISILDFHPDSVDISICQIDRETIDIATSGQSIDDTLIKEGICVR